MLNNLLLKRIVAFVYSYIVTNCILTHLTYSNRVPIHIYHRESDICTKAVTSSVVPSIHKCPLDTPNFGPSAEEEEGWLIERKPLIGQIFKREKMRPALNLLSTSSTTAEEKYNPLELFQFCHMLACGHNSEVLLQPWRGCIRTFVILHLRFIQSPTVNKIPCQYNLTGSLVALDSKCY